MTDRFTEALIVAAGRGVRAGEGLPKQYRKVGGVSLLRRSVDAFLAHPEISAVRVVIAAGDEDLYAEAIGDCDVLDPVVGGATRQDSVRAGLEAIAHDSADRVLIHDAARPGVSPGMIDRVLAALDANPGAAPALPVVDSIRTGGSHVEGEIDRTTIQRVQTPQGFTFDAILAAHRAASPGATDDIAVARAAGLKVALVAGDERAFKVTEPADFARAEALFTTPLVSRSASGFDVHRFGPGDHVWLCGVRIPHSHGLIGHSDADAGLHALTDALLGTIAAGDIGDHFPPSDPRWRGAASDRFLAYARDLVLARGGRIDHADVTIIAERPKVGPHRSAMRERIAAILGIPMDAVSVKATTTEGLGFTGRSEGIAAQATASVRLPETSVAHVLPTAQS